MLVAALFIGVGLARIQAKKEGIDPEKLSNLLFLAFIWGIAGSRIFYVVENMEYYLRQPLEIIMLQHGGLSWFGGLILGAAAGIYYLKRNNLPVYKTLDLCVPFLALAQAIGRIGCLFNGCCFGKESATGFYFPAHSAVLIPIQLYSSLALLFIFVVLRLLQDRPHRQGQIFLVYLVLYSLKRLFIEFWRADNPPVLYGLTLFQCLSILLLAFSLVKLVLIAKSKD